MENNNVSIQHINLLPDTDDMDVEVKQACIEYFDLDKIILTAPKEHLWSDAETHAMEQLHATTKHLGDRYETGLLWKSTEPELPESYRQAFQRLRVAETKMIKDPELKEWYVGKINEYVEKGYAYKISIERYKNPLGPVWYLPHFVVSNPNKENKKRLIYDRQVARNFSERTPS